MSGAYARQIGASTNNADGMTGVIVPTARGWSMGTTVVSADACRFGRFSPPFNILVASISFEVTSAATNNDLVQAGIYDSTGTTVLASSSAAAVGVNSTGRKTCTLTANLQLLAGTAYYAALAYDYASGTGATIGIASFGSTLLCNIAGVGAPNQLADSMSAQPTLPAALTFANASSAGPLLYLNPA